jgi:hypothetical protein
VSSIKYQCGWINIWNDPVHFNEFWIAIFAYMNIFDMRTMILCHRNEKKINQKSYIQLKNTFWTTVAFLRCCNLIWGLANNNYSLYFLQFLTDWQFTFVLYFHSLAIVYIVGPLSKLTVTLFFCWRLHKYDLLQFVWYWITAQ